MKEAAAAAKAVYEGIMGMYAELFHVWADYPFLIQFTLFFALLVVLFLLCKYALIPALLLVYANGLLRAWNYLVIESLHELLYVWKMSNPNKKPSLFFVARYKNFGRSVERNRAYIDKEPLTDGMHAEQTYRKIVNLRLRKKILVIVKWMIAVSIFMLLLFLLFHYEKAPFRL